MGCIRCDSCERVVDLDYDSEPVWDEESNTWLCGTCQERVEQYPEMEEER